MNNSWIQLALFLLLARKHVRSLLAEFFLVASIATDAN